MWYLSKVNFQLIALVFVLGFVWMPVCAQESEAMYVLDENSKGLVNIQEVNPGNYTTFHAYLNLRPNSTPQDILVKIEGNGTIFFDGALVYQSFESRSESEELSWDRDSLRQVFGHRRLLVSFSGFQKTPEMLFKHQEESGLSTHPVDKLFPVVPKPKSSLSDEHLIILAFTFLLLVIFKMSYPRAFGDYFDLASTLRFKPRNEVFYDSRKLEPQNLLFYFLYGNVISVLAIWFFPQLLDNYFPALINTQMMVKHIAIAVSIFIAIPLKGFLISIFAQLFAVREFSRVHFLDFLRIGFLGALGFFVLGLLYTTYGMFGQGEWILAILLVSLLFVRIMLLLYKLLNIVGNERMYLFSYLCTIELVPFFFLVKFIIGVN